MVRMELDYNKDILENESLTFSSFYTVNFANIAAFIHYNSKLPPQLM